MLSENTKEQFFLLCLDVNESDLQSIMKFVYKGELKVEPEDLPRILKIAQMLQIKVLPGNSNVYFTFTSSPS